MPETSILESAGAMGLRTIMSLFGLGVFVSAVMLILDNFGVPLGRWIAVIGFVMLLLLVGIFVPMMYSTESAVRM